MITASMVVATVPITDLARAKKFYGDALGLELLWENPVSARFRCGDASELSVFQRPPLDTSHTLAHFEVDDIEAAIKELEGPLVTTGHIAKIGPARGAWFRDPDGNTLGLRGA